jgi:tetratricopeptide (TPR) repeat protein
MPDRRAERVAELVKSAVECGPGQWAAFLDRECGSAPALRAEIESLLLEDEAVSQFLEKPAFHLAAESLAREGAFRPSQIIGEYEIVSLIGSGGMGEVYLAHDRDLHRKVALKLVRRAMASEEMIHHFKREEHLLASLNHPNIAQLYGGGVTPDGIPFFAMEYVEGEGLDRYCDGRALATKDRLQLFRKVCSAVTYAHQHLVIHRDLKPANIRVTPEGEPKLLDFGIAKLLDAENAPEGGQTITLQGVMTPEYASPEQVAGESITTASDVYSLGVVLYKLLTGQSPYRTKTNRPDEIARAIVAQEPTRPSTVVSGDRKSEIRDLKSLRGDLDNIILMALRKEPQRRYSSVAQFSEDIRRHLDGRPVVARKDTFKYRAAKFIGRNKIGVTAAALLTVTVIAGIVTTVVEAQRAEQQRARAEKRFAELRKLSNALLSEILPGLAPGTTGGGVILAQRALEYLDALAKEGGNDPALQYELAGAYRVLAEQIDLATGNYAAVAETYRKSLALYEGLVKAKPTDPEMRNQMARLYERVGWSLWRAGDMEEAMVLFEKALPVREGLVASKPLFFEYRYPLAHLHMSIGDLLTGNEAMAEAARHYREALVLMEALPKGESPEHDLRMGRGFIYCHNHIAETLWRDNDFAGALLEFDRALEILEVVYPTAPEDRFLRNLRGDIYEGQTRTYRSQKDFERALAIARKRVAMWEAIPSGDHSLREPLAIAYSDLGELLSDTGEIAQGSEYLAKAIRIFEEQLAGGTKSRNLTSWLGWSYGRLALVEQKQDRYQDALKNYGKALILHEQNAAGRKDGDVRYELALCCDAIARLHMAMASAKDVSAEDGAEHWREARSLSERSREIIQKLYEQHPERDLFKKNLEEVTEQLNRCDNGLARL